jgi:hypothetical protein
MWQWIVSWLTNPIIKGLLTAQKQALDAGNTREQIEATLAARELAVQQREGELNTQYKIALIGHWYEPVQLACYVMVAYLGKAIFWDNVVMADWVGGNTNPLRGDVLTWAGALLLFMVGKRTIENSTNIVASVFRRR